MTDTLLVLGADGDLTRRLLLPGLGTLLAGDRREGRRPPVLLGAGLRDLSATEWRQRVRGGLSDGGARGGPSKEVVRSTRYRNVDVTDVTALAQLLDECEGRAAIYFALPPSVTAAACEALLGLELPPGTVLAMEKPFGTDRSSAARLNGLVTSLVPEGQVFRVDHFLGRADVLNVLGVRFANRLLEPVWNNQHVESIEIVYDEDLALEGRAGYYDRAGALVDMVQSHLLQVMALVMMEPVASIDSHSFREARNAVLRATRLAGPPADVSRRACYTKGRIGRREVPAYTREPGVDVSRRTETLAEVTVEVRNPRWAGVPVTLRSGKALGAPRKEAVVRLRPVAHLPAGLVGHETPDTVTIGFRPPRLGIHLDVSGEGDPFDLSSTALAAELDPGELTAYGEVLAGILDGDPLLAVRGDTAEECWRILEPVIEAWREDEVPMDTYPAGSAGPPAW
ncbi:glucose-6-phosphate dehydrogenase [Nocardioides sp. GCM10027113]|uniref:glucose-6-phosphate dehydrogenase n=1 Tax=unclassified Nocardioides TaxID=2615069 RepID=UPI00360C9453